MNGLVFAGCSFTWGEGLELYSTLNTIEWDSFKNFTYRFDNVGYFMPKSHIRFIESNRFPRVVANHFNTFDLVHELNGGNHYTMLGHIQKCLVDYKNDIDYIIVQPTEIARGVKIHDNCSKSCCEIDFIRMLESYYQYKSKDDEFSRYYEILVEEFGDNESKILDVFNHRQYSSYDLFIKKLIQINKETNIPVKFIRSWNPQTESETTYKSIDSESADFILNNYIPFNYNNQIYESMVELIERNDNLLIKDDYDFSNNWHPNLKCHKIFAESIIQYLEKK